MEVSTMHPRSDTLSAMASKGSKPRRKTQQAAHVTPPGEVSIIEAANDRPPVINAGPTIEDPAAVKRVFTVRGPHDGVSRVLAYRRVSTMEQMLSGTSLDAQDEEIRRYCQYSRLPDPVDFEEAESGGAESEEKRERIAALLKAVRPGDLVIVAKLDRFSRDIVFTISAVRDIIRRGARFLSLAERFDPSTPEGDTNGVVGLYRPDGARTYSRANAWQPEAPPVAWQVRRGAAAFRLRASKGARHSRQAAPIGDRSGESADRSRDVRYVPSGQERA
jgi:hypothetical protein